MQWIEEVESYDKAIGVLVPMEPVAKKWRHTLVLYDMMKAQSNLMTAQFHLITTQKYMKNTFQTTMMQNDMMKAQNNLMKAESNLMMRYWFNNDAKVHNEKFSCDDNFLHDEGPK